MDYITIKRFKSKGMAGDFNIPYNTPLFEVDGVLLTQEPRPVCMATSENAHQYFAYNGDGQGLLRGQLTQAIQKKLSKRDSNYQARWDKIWEDKLCQRYKRIESADFWLWNHEFYRAPILDLKYIAGLVGAE